MTCDIGLMYLHFQMGQGIQVFKSGLTKFCERQPLENLLSPLLNSLSQIAF